MSGVRIRDPIHVSIELSDTERKLLDSEPFQRLRHLHQLATTFLIFPSATHKRFEHSLGVLELSTRTYRVLTANLSADLRRRWNLESEFQLNYWERVLRVAALCHDLGHLPFSHGVEDLLEDVDHEDLSRQVIEGPIVGEILGDCRPTIVPADVVKLALERNKLTDCEFSEWEEILNQVITGSCFGADRMDYLLRDSYHLGVSHGHFDHHRLIECLRILPEPPTPGGETSGYALGIIQGGLQSAEALLLARYMMFSQVYYHKTRLIFDFHLKQFVSQWLAGREDKSPASLLALTDNDVFVALEAARRAPAVADNDTAKRLLERRHFRFLYQRMLSDDKVDAAAFELITAGLQEKYGALVYSTTKAGKARDKVDEEVDFPVLQPGSLSTVSSLAVSQVLRALPQTGYSIIYAAPEIRDEAQKWLEENKLRLLQETGGQ